MNGNFAQQVVFLSQQLECSEKFVAELFNNVVSEQPNMEPSHYLEAAVSQFHSNRRALVDCLQFLFEAAEFSESTGNPLLAAWQPASSFVGQRLSSQGPGQPCVADLG